MKIITLPAFSRQGFVLNAMHNRMSAILCQLAVGIRQR